MAKPMAFILLLVIAINPQYFPQGMQLWGALAKNSLCEGTVELLSDSSLFSITQRLTQPPHITTTSKQRHAPKKHIRKKHILIAIAFKQAGGSGGAGHPKAASKVERLVAQSPVPYLINIGTGTSSTQPHQELLNFRMLEHLIRLRCIVFDRGKGWWMARRNRIRSRRVCSATESCCRTRFSPRPSLVYRTHCMGLLDQTEGYLLSLTKHHHAQEVRHHQDIQ